MHHVFVRDIAIGEDDLVHGVAATQGLESPPRLQSHSGIQRSRQQRLIRPARNPGNLGRSEGNPVDRRVIAIHHIEIVKVATCRPGNDNASARFGFGWFRTCWHSSNGGLMSTSFSLGMSIRPAGLTANIAAGLSIGVGPSLAIAVRAGNAIY
jgi:hypothetical protein